MMNGMGPDPSIPIKTDPRFTIEGLTTAGFTGFVTFADLPPAGVPNVDGVYVVVRSSLTPPQFLEASPAGRFKRRDPSVSVEKLDAAWVPCTQVV
jgi:hypothetical protein